MAHSEVRSAASASPTGASRIRRILMIQTQAENAGAQEISRILSEALSERGFDVRQLFLFRRTSSFDDAPNTIFCADERPGGGRALARLIGKLVREVRRIRPDAVLSFQHYGNLFG